MMLLGNMASSAAGGTGMPVLGSAGGGIGSGESAAMLYHFLGISSIPRVILISSGLSVMSRIMRREIYNNIE